MPGERGPDSSPKIAAQRDAASPPARSPFADLIAAEKPEENSAISESDLSEQSAPQNQSRDEAIATTAAPPSHNQDQGSHNQPNGPMATEEPIADSALKTNTTPKHWPGPHPGNPAPTSPDLPTAATDTIPLTEFPKGTWTELSARVSAKGTLGKQSDVRALNTYSIPDQPTGFGAETQQRLAIRNTSSPTMRHVLPTRPILAGHSTANPKMPSERMVPVAENKGTNLAEVNSKMLGAQITTGLEPAGNSANSSTGQLAASTKGHSDALATPLWLANTSVKSPVNIPIGTRATPLQQSIDGMPVAESPPSDTAANSSSLAESHRWTTLTDTIVRQNLSQTSLSSIVAADASEAREKPAIGVTLPHPTAARPTRSAGGQSAGGKLASDVRKLAGDPDIEGEKDLPVNRLTPGKTPKSSSPQLDASLTSIRWSESSLENRTHVAVDGDPARFERPAPGFHIESAATSNLPQQLAAADATAQVAKSVPTDPWTNSTLAKNEGPSQFGLTADVLKQVSQGMGRQVSNHPLDKPDSFTIRLDPPKLGKVTVEIEPGHSGLKISLRPENSWARQALETSLQALQTQLEGQGVPLMNLNVSTELADRQQRFQQQPEDETPTQTPAVDSTTPGTEIDDNQTAISGQIDLRV